MDLQLTNNSKMNSGPYKRQKTSSAGLEQSASKKREVQQLDVKISADG
jgi:hypothetical protein